MSIRVRVPATSANLGSGVDCMGVALALYLNVLFEKTDLPDHRFEWHLGKGELPPARPEDNYILTGMRLVEQAYGCRVPFCNVTVQSDIPLARGLGSSASALVAGILGAFALCGLPFDENKALSLATNAEGHPDNVAPAVKGGFTVASGDAESLFVQSVHVPDGKLRAVVAIPSFTLSTERMRKVLPDSVPLSDAVRQVQHACLLVSALQNGDWKCLSEASGDLLFTPYRKMHMPYLDEAFRTGRDAGALCCMISGSGPSVLAFAADDETASRIREEWENLFVRLSVSCDIRILEIDRTGAALFDETGGS